MRFSLGSFLPLLALTTALPARAEPPGVLYGERLAENSVYAEALGPGLLYSIDYDRAFGDFSGRIGMGLVLGSEKSANGSSSVKPILLSIPVMVNYIGSGSRWTMLEVGAGFVLLHAGAHLKNFYVQDRASALTSPMLTALVGIRYQPPGGGFTMRGGVSMLESRYGFLPLWPYVSAGYAF